MTGLQPGAATMTVLFTDLVDSTAMRSRIGDDQADDVRREHDELIAQLVDENRGSIVKGLGDGIMAVFGAPSAGIASAVGIQQAIARRNRGAKFPIALKMGLSVGEVRVEADDVYGTPVVEASRLCSAAGADQILTAEHVKLLAGSRSTATYRSFGELELKGLSEPLRTLEVLWWEASDAPSVPFPEIPALTQGAGFAGRSIERYAIGHAWLNARTAKAPVVFVSGPDGIGKTRLAAEFARRTTQNEGGIVLYGRCSEGGGPAFQPFAEAIRYYVSNVPSGQLADLLGAFAGELVRAVPELGEQLPNAKRAPSGDPAFESLRLFDAVAGWLSAASRDEPMVLILDDLQWASRSTLDLLRHVADSPTPMRLLIVAIARDTGPSIDDLQHLQEKLRQSGRGVEAIELRGLGVDDVEALVTDTIADVGPKAPALAARLHQVTGGNPLYALELAHQLVGAGAITPGTGDRPATMSTDVDQLVLPPTVDEAVASRVLALEWNVVKVLELAAVVGDEWDLAVVRSLAALKDDDFAAALDVAMGAGLVVELPGARQRYAFAHVVQQRAIAGIVDQDRRNEWHGQIVAEIERDAGTDDDRYMVDLARHHLAAHAAGGDTEAAVAACLRVAQRARDQLAADEAVTWYRRALDVLEPGGDDARILPVVLALGEVEQLAGLDSARTTLLRAATLAKQAGDRDRLVAAVIANVRPFTGRAGPLDAERVAVLRDAAELTTDGPPVMRARVLALLASEMVWAPDADDRFALADEALDLARGVDDQRLLASVLLLRLPTIATPDTLAQRAEVSDELFALAGDLEDPVLRFHAALHRSQAGGEAGDIEAFDHWLGIAAVVASGLDLPLLTWLVSLARASRAYLAGDLTGAERHADEALAAGLAADRPEAQLFHGAVVLAVRNLQGRIDEVTGAIDPKTSSANTDMFLLSRAVADAGRIEEVEPRYRQMAAIRFPLRREPYVGATLANLAYLSALIGDAEGAEILYGRLEPLADRFSLVIVFQHVGAHYLGMLAATLERDDDAHRWFRRAVELHESVKAPLFAAETRLEWARVCFAVGDVDHARELIGQALTAAVKGNAAGLETQARTLLNATFTTGEMAATPDPGEATDESAPAAQQAPAPETAEQEPSAQEPSEQEPSDAAAPVDEPAGEDRAEDESAPAPVAPAVSETPAPPVSEAPPVPAVPPRPAVPPPPAPIPVFVPAAAAPPPAPPGPPPAPMPPPPGPPVAPAPMMPPPGPPPAPMPPPGPPPAPMMPPPGPPVAPAPPVPPPPLGQAVPPRPPVPPPPPGYAPPPVPPTGQPPVPPVPSPPPVPPAPPGPPPPPVPPPPPGPPPPPAPPGPPGPLPTAPDDPHSMGPALPPDDMAATFAPPPRPDDT